MLYRTRHALLVALILAMTSGCGGSGSSSPPAPPAPTALSLAPLVSGTEASSHSLSFPTPGFDGHSVVAAQVTGPLALAASQFPVPVSADAASLTVTSTPVAPGRLEGVVTLTLERAGTQASRVYVVSTRVEVPDARLAESTLDFGAVGTGETARRTATVFNDSEVSTLTLSTFSIEHSALSLVSPTLPARVDPGERLALEFELAPQAQTVLNETVQLDVGLSSSLLLSLQSTSTLGGSEQVVEYGVQTIGSDGNTAELTVDVPADAISLTFEAEGSPSDRMGLGFLVGPGNRVYENLILTGAYIWQQQFEHFSTTVPNTDRSATQLVSGGGTYRFRLRKLSGPSSALTVRVRIERRDDVVLVPNVLPLNVWMAPGLSVNAAGAATDTRMQAILARVDAILAVKNIRLGDIDYYNLTNSAHNVIDSSAELQSIARLSSSAQEDRLNLVFAETVLGGGVVGVALRVAGPKKKGSPFAAVASIYEGSTANFIGLVAAHELGHFLGLFHTTEQNGSHDFIDDTPECPASGAGGPCSTPGGGMLMHWQAVGGTTITDGQALVLRGHPYIEAGTNTAERQALRKASTRSRSTALIPWGSVDDAAAALAGDCWCGSCRSARGKRARSPADAK